MATTEAKADTENIHFLRSVLRRICWRSSYNTDSLPMVMQNILTAAVLFLSALATGPEAALARGCLSCDHDWARRATPETVKEMFDAGFSPNAISKFNKPVIFLIAMVGDDPAVAKAFSEEAKSRDSELTLVHMHSLGFVETTVLHYASRNRSPAMLKYFLELGADTTLRDEREKTPLHVAPGYSENPETYSLLLDAGVGPNARDALGWTALHGAARFSKNPEIFRMLVEKGADVNARTDSGHTPLWIAENYREDAVVDLLRSLGAE